MIIETLLKYMKLLLTQYCPICKGVGRVQAPITPSVLFNGKSPDKICESCCGTHYPSSVIQEFNRVRHILRDLGVKVNDEAEIVSYAIQDTSQVATDQ